MVLVCEPGGELGEQLREHAGHVCQGGDDRGGVGGIDKVRESPNTIRPRVPPSRGLPLPRPLRFVLPAD